MPITLRFRPAFPGTFQRTLGQNDYNRTFRPESATDWPYVVCIFGRPSEVDLPARRERQLAGKLSAVVPTAAVHYHAGYNCIAHAYASPIPHLSTALIPPFHCVSMGRAQRCPTFRQGRARQTFLLRGQGNVLTGISPLNGSTRCSQYSLHFIRITFALFTPSHRKDIPYPLGRSTSAQQGVPQGART